MKLWKKLICVLLALALSFSMLSCGGTSDGETHTADGEDTASDNQKEPDNAENTEIPEKEPVKEGTFTDEDGNVRQVSVHEGADGLVTFLIDAEVLNKDAADLPIIEVTHDYFDSEELEAIILPFIGDNVLYELYPEWQSGDYSRTFESDYEYHPEEYYKSEYFEEGSIDYSRDFEEFNALSIVDELPRSFRALRHHHGVCSVNNFIVGYYSMVPAVRELPFLQTNNFTEEDIENAIADVREYLDGSVFEYWQLRSYKVERIGAGKVALVMDFVPTYHGTPMLFAAEKTGSYNWKFDVEQDWQYHELEVSYSNGEIVDLFVRSPIEVLSETPKTLISYDEAIEAVFSVLEESYSADQMLSQYYEKFPESKNTVLSWNVYVEKLELVYVRVPSADTPEHYYLIPTWVVYGGHGINEQMRNNTVVTVGNKYSGEGEPIAFISAIDGTPIDFENGY